MSMDRKGKTLKPPYFLKKRIFFFFRFIYFFFFNDLSHRLLTETAIKVTAHNVITWSYFAGMIYTCRATSGFVLMDVGDKKNVTRATVPHQQRVGEQPQQEEGGRFIWCVPLRTDAQIASIYKVILKSLSVTRFQISVIHLSTGRL